VRATLLLPDLGPLRVGLRLELLFHAVEVGEVGTRHGIGRSPYRVAAIRLDLVHVPGMLLASQMRPIAHTYSCWGVSCMEAQPVHTRMIGSRAIRREDDPFAACPRERVAMATSFDGSNFPGGVYQKLAQKLAAFVDSPGA
jgi:hypothetical protein